jgi:AcrR family transcriptional regulator
VLSAGVAGGRRRSARVIPVHSRRGDLLVSRAQRSRMLRAAVAVVHERGYGDMTVARITGRAGVSRRTFYDMFEDREDCFLAAFDDAAAHARELMLEACRAERGWRDQTRAALLALLELLDVETGMQSLLIADALKAGPRVQRHRAEILTELAAALHSAATRSRTGRELPPLTSEGVTGAVLGIVHTRVLGPEPDGLVELLNALMAMIVLPYMGPRAAHRELERPVPAGRPAGRAESGTRREDVLAGVGLRITRRTLLVLSAIAGHPGASNRQVADLAGISDPGQTSRLLARLHAADLIRNTSLGQPAGGPNRWHLTSYGQRIYGTSTTEEHNRTSAAGAGYA